MKALVVYHSEYGNTAKIAQAIAAGIKEAGLADVTVKGTGSANAEDFKAADLWIVGSPTHIGSATGEVKKAVKMAIESGAKGKHIVACDTRFKDSPKGGVNKIESMMTEGGAKTVIAGEHFVVLKSKGPLADGEEAKANEFGKKIAGALRH